MIGFSWATTLTRLRGEDGYRPTVHQVLESQSDALAGRRRETEVSPDPCPGEHALGRVRAGGNALAKLVGDHLDAGARPDRFRQGTHQATCVRTDRDEALFGTDTELLHPCDEGLPACPVGRGPSGLALPSPGDRQPGLANLPNRTHVTAVLPVVVAPDP
ncbi:hypothetical protein OG244_04270 [Streptomyces brevispora]|uniref:hypothetical protein n=1 Tax=Streptomyces brevispora TaxID=887462 RepID=UPI002E375BBF|nr:hypothetical protein [Streptomyces brevispora]